VWLGPWPPSTEQIELKVSVLRNRTDYDSDNTRLGQWTIASDAPAYGYSPVTTVTTPSGSVIK
jgi:hypothetical protein